MSDSVLRPDDIGPADADRILRFLNGVDDAQALAETVGFAEGLQIGLRIGFELVAARPFGSIDQVLAVTGVTLPRFTELAVALSGARPPLASDTLRFLSTETVMWLGQTTPVTLQLTNPEGLGRTTRQVTCIVPDGIITAHSGAQIQTGSAVRIAPEPGGLVRFTFGPRMTPALDTRARAALSAELSQLDRSATTPDEGRKAIQLLAARYRGQGAGALQAAIDQLYETFDAPATSSAAPWPIQPMTVLALTHDDTGQVLQAASLTFDIRNWLAAFYDELKRQVDADSLLPDALKMLSVDASAGRDLSRQIMQATQSYAGLERGVLGRQLSSANSGRVVNAFLDANTQTLKGDAIVNTVRAAGASETAISSGGFAAFEAIRSVQEVSDVVRQPSKADWLTPKDLAPFGDRLASLEKTTLTRAHFNSFENRLGEDFDARFKAMEEAAVTREDLNVLSTSLTSQMDARLENFEGGRAMDDRFSKINGRLNGLEEGTIRRADLDALSVSLTRDFDAKLKRAGERNVTEERLMAFRSEVNTQLETSVPRAEVEEMIKALEADTNAKLGDKANARSVAELKTSISKVSTRQTKLETRVGTGGGGRIG